MANELPREQIEQLVAVFEREGSVHKTAKLCEVSRQTVRRYISELRGNLSAPADTFPVPDSDFSFHNLHRYLDRQFAEPWDGYSEELMKAANQMAMELGRSSNQIDRARISLVMKEIARHQKIVAIVDHQIRDLGDPQLFRTRMKFIKQLSDVADRQMSRIQSLLRDVDASKSKGNVRISERTTFSSK